MLPKIAKRGPLRVVLPNGGSLDLWYNPHIKLWTLQQRDEAGNQIGPAHAGEAAYHAKRSDAVAEMRVLLAKSSEAKDGCH